jgi:hypothetical protein
MSNKKKKYKCRNDKIDYISLSVTCDRSVVFSEYSGSPTNKNDRHEITEILLKVALNTIKKTNKQTNNQTNDFSME